MRRAWPRLLAIGAGLCAALRARPARAEAPSDVERAVAEYLRAHGDRPITGMRVEGLRRTRPAVVEQWLTCRVGARLSSCDLPSIRDRIYRLAMFKRADVSLVDGRGGVEIVITIVEKWSLYPVPALWYTPGTELAGLVLVEANLLGFNKGVALGGVVSNRGWYTIAAYSDPNIAFTDGWGSLRVLYGSGTVEDDAPDGSIVQSFDMRRLDVEYVLGWTFFDRLSPALTGGLRSARVRGVRVPGDEAATDASVVMQGLALTWSDRRYRDRYDEGLRASVEVQHAFSARRGTASYQTAILDLKYARPTPLDGFWELHAHAFFGALPPVFEERLGGLDGSRTIPGSGLVAVDRYASLSLETQVPVVRGSLGTLSAVAFGEVGRYARGEETAHVYGGAGVGVRFHLRDVAVPAFGADLGYEVASKRIAVSVAIGYRPLR
jgi:hypothetical protein